MYLSVNLKRAISSSSRKDRTILHLTHVIFPGNLKIFYYLNKIPQRWMPDIWKSENK